MSTLFGLIWFVTLIAFIVFWWKKRTARKAGGADYKNDPNYIKVSKRKRIIGAVCIISFLLGGLTQPSMTPEEKAKIETEKQAKAEKKAKEAERESKEKEQKRLTRIASLDGEEKNVYHQKFQEYIQKFDEQIAQEKALEAVDEYLRKKADEATEAERKAKEAEAQLAKMEAEKKENRKGLDALEKAGKIQYFDLGNGTCNVVITERATLKHDTGDFNKLANYAMQDEHQRNIISTAKQCMLLVQTVKNAGIKVNNFTINLTGDTVDSAGYKSVDNIVICEISGSKNFSKDDPYSFYNNTDRYWMINGL